MQAKHTICRRRGATAAYSSTSTGETDRKIDYLTAELKSLEAERDEAIKTGESCARTSVRLTDMVQLLDKLALEKVEAGDEESAKSVLKEKASVNEMLERTNERAKNNFLLAAKLAEFIGQKQNELVDVVHGARASGTGAGFAGSASTSAVNGGSQQSYATAPAQGYTPSMPKWEQSILEAKERIKRAEQEAGAAGRMGRMTAEESIAAARQRMRVNEESIAAAQLRLRKSAEESIAEAQERLRRQEAAAMVYLQQLAQRYRQGEYIPEDELDLAFRQLGKL